MKEIIENNKLIAEFMGSDQPDFAKINGALIPLKNCAYSYSWDWLMPAVQKITSSEHNFIFKIIEQEYYCEIQCYCDEGNLVREIAQYGETEIDAVYNVVVEFIKWYNENK